MKLGETLRYMFPDANFLTDIIVRDDGQGAYVAHWGLPDPQPDQAGLDQAWIDLQTDRQDRATERDRIRTEANLARQQLELLADTPTGQWRQVDIVMAIKFILSWLIEHDQK